MHLDELTLNRIELMLVLQDSVNKEIHPNWRNFNHPWYRAIWTECAEMLDHIGWKWWKHQVPNISQLQLELVDIWHFGLSDILQRSGEPADAAKNLHANLNFDNSLFLEIEKESLLKIVENFAFKVLKNKEFNLVDFCILAQKSGLSFDELYKQYVQKNVLNRFRQDHGYKEGTYVKLWQGREDNVWLTEMCRDLDSAMPDYMDRIYCALLGKYNLVETKL